MREIGQLACGRQDLDRMLAPAAGRGQLPVDSTDEEEAPAAGRVRVVVWLVGWLSEAEENRNSADRPGGTGAPGRGG
jgi:hypothetical protein